MSHSGENIVCPNCGFHTTHNYCAQCGQETHLHKDTLWALTTHFIGHYIHYDSKFWQTLKTLVVSPGKLTLAYWNKQRSRYLSPISLYLFVSFIYFLVISFAFSGALKKMEEQATHDEIILSAGGVDSSTISRTNALIGKSDTETSSKENGPSRAEVMEVVKHFFHMIPKFFFFMIPVMAVILKLLFFKRRDLTIVHHTIFSLHVQTFFFLLLTFTTKNGHYLVLKIITIILIIVPIVYTSLALKNVYNINWKRSVAYNIIIIISYSIMFLVIVLLYIILQMIFLQHKW